MLPITIEDLVLFIYHAPNEFDPKGLNPRDRSIFYSIASQLKRNLPLTSKQADLVIKIIRDNQNLYKSIENLNFLLDNPRYKFPFRVVDTSRKIFLDLDKQEIRVKFPFDQKINKTLEKIRSGRSYDNIARCHVYKIKESNIIELIENLKDYNFEIDQKILEWYHEIKEITNNPEKYLPTADVIDGAVVLKNTNNAAIEYFNQHRKDNIIADAYLSKFMGNLISNSLQNELSKHASSLTKKIISAKNNNRFVISEESTYNKFDVSCFIAEANPFPVLIFINESDDLFVNFKQWIIGLNRYSIENQNISVLFRSDVNNEFNNMIRDLGLNNHVNQNTKVIFVKHKIPKILYKLNFKPKLIITTSSFYAHYTGNKMIDAHPLVLYYTEGPYERGNTKFVKL